MEAVAVVETSGLIWEWRHGQAMEGKTPAARRNVGLNQLALCHPNGRFGDST